MQILVEYHLIDRSDVLVSSTNNFSRKHRDWMMLRKFDETRKFHVLCMQHVLCYM